MKKQGRNFILLVTVLAALAAGYICLVRYNREQQEKETGQVEGEVLVDIARDDILRFSYVFQGETYGFEKKEGLWTSDADPSRDLKQSSLDAMAGSLTRIVAQNTFTDVTDLAQYGLEEPSNVLHWETAQGNYTYLVGDYNSLGSVYYICEPDSRKVYAVTASLGTGFGYSLEELTEEKAESTEQSDGAESADSQPAAE